MYFHPIYEHQSCVTSSFTGLSENVVGFSLTHFLKLQINTNQHSGGGTILFENARETRQEYIWHFQQIAAFLELNINQ